MKDILRLQGVSKAFGGVQALNEIDLAVDSDGITGLIGPNGSGKTTLFNVVSGFIRADSGNMLFKGEQFGGRRPDSVARIGIRRTFQVPRVARAMTTLENLLLAVEDQPSGSLLSLFNPLRRRRVAAGSRAARNSALETAETLGLHASVDKPAGTLSGGQLKLLSLGVALLGKPKLLLLDEPMAGVNRVLVERISGVLLARHREEEMPIILIEHDLAVVEALCKRVIVLDNGRIIADGAPAAIREDAEVKAAYLGRRAVTR